MAGGRLHRSLRGGGNGRQTARHTRTHIPIYIQTGRHTHIYIYIYTHTHTHTQKDRQTDRGTKRKARNMSRTPPRVVFGRKTASPEDRRKDAERDILRQFDENENRKTVAERCGQGLHAGGILNEEAVLAATGEYTLEAVRDPLSGIKASVGLKKGARSLLA